VLFYDDFESVSEWGGPYGSGAAYASWRSENEQAIMSFNRLQPTDPSAVPGWYAAWEPYRTYTFGTNTLEFSMDLLEANRDDAFALLTVNELGALSGYMFGVDRNEAFFCKFGDKGGSWSISYFYGGLHGVTRTNLGLSLAFTRYANELVICSRILDRDNANEVLWQRDVHDTAAQDQVLPNQGWKGLQMGPEGYAPPVSGTLEVGIGIVYLNTQEAPTEPLEVTVDNYTVLQYPAAAISKAHSVLLSWPEDTFDEQIVVCAGSLDSDAVWMPCPEPMYQRFGCPSVSVPAGESAQFFKLVPGTQFIDRFDDLKQPFATRNPWEPWFHNGGDASRFTITLADGVLKIQTLQDPVSGMVMVNSPGGGEIVRDFYASVDILDWGSSSQNSALGIAGRVQGSPSGGVTGMYLGSMQVNPAGVPGTAQLVFFDGNADRPVPGTFSITAGKAYRLQFSAVGSQLTIRLVDLTDGRTVKDGYIQDSRHNQGRVALWVNTRGSSAYARTVDNFFMTGTMP